MKFINQALLVATAMFVMSGCSSSMITHGVDGSITCLNCGNTRDGILKVQSTMSVNDLYIVVHNISDASIVLDERYFAFAEGGNVVPLTSWLHGSQESYEYRVSGTLSQARSLEYWRKDLKAVEATTAVSTVKNESAVTTGYSPIVVIPSGSRWLVRIRNYYLAKLEELAESTRHYDEYYGYSETKWDSVATGIRNLQNRPLSVTITFKFLNEDGWRNATVNMTSHDVHMTTNER